MTEEELKQQANPKNYSSLWEWFKANKWLVLLSPIYLIFGLVAAILSLMAKTVGVTYKEMNICIYYFVIPLSWCFLLDVGLIDISIPLQTEEQLRYDGSGRWITFPLLSFLWCLLWAYIIYRNRHTFKTWCSRAFDNSVKFLLWFRIIGWNYYISSVIICVIVPLLVYCALIYLCYAKAVF